MCMALLFSAIFFHRPISPDPAEGRGYSSRTGGRTFTPTTVGEERTVSFFNSRQQLSAFNHLSEQIRRVTLQDPDQIFKISTLVRSDLENSTAGLLRLQTQIRSASCSSTSGVGFIFPATETLLCLTPRSLRSRTTDEDLFRFQPRISPACRRRTHLSDHGHDEPPGTDKLRQLHSLNLPPPPDTLASVLWDLSSGLDPDQPFSSSRMNLNESHPEDVLVTPPLKPRRCSRGLCAAVVTVRLGRTPSSTSLGLDRVYKAVTGPLVQTTFYLLKICIINWLPSLLSIFKPFRRPSCSPFGHYV